MSSGLNGKVSVDGLEKLSAVLARMGPNALEAAQAAMADEMDSIMEEAKRRTPVDVGTLKGSGSVFPPERVGDQITVTAGFGGAASDYAVVVHEDLNANHPIGEAKFLEKPMLERADAFPKNLATRIAAALLNR